MTATERRRPSRAEVRERVLAAALRRFATDGYDATTLDAIAAEAGFSKGAVYSNFDGKESLLAALIDQQVELRVQAARDHLQREAEPIRRDALERLGELITVVSDASPEWNLLWTEHVVRASRDREEAETLRTRRRGARELVISLLADFDAPAPLGIEATATVLLALVNGLALERIVDPDAVPPDLLGHAFGLLIADEPPPSLDGR